MIVIVDANVMLRYVETTAPHHPVAVASVAHFVDAGDDVRTLPQCLYEFWVVATRPLANNGLGLSTATADIELAGMEALFPLVHDPASLYAGWRSLVGAHDARIAAAMRAHGLAHLHTFNGADFARFPILTALDPHALAPQP